MFNLDRKYIYIILAVLVLISLFSYIRNPESLLSLVLTLPGVIIAITFHEFAHAWAADKCGDETPRMQGRLTLNPLKHIDPIGLLMLMSVHFGWGKPVEINPRNFNRKMSTSAQEALVSLAGPLMNIILAIVFIIILNIMTTFVASFCLTQVGIIILMIIRMTIIVNIGLGVFNLIPLPPLDGSKILMHFLPYNAKNWFLAHKQIFYIVFLILWIFGFVSYIISPIINAVYYGLNYCISALFSLFI